MIRMLCKILTDITCHCKTDIGVDIDLTYSKLCCMTKLLFRNTYSIGHVSAVLVNHLNKFLRNRRRTMKNDGETRKSLDALLKNVETKWRGNKDTVCITGTLCSSELVCTVRGSDCDCQRVTACLINKLFNLFRMCIALLTSFYNNFIFNTCKSTKLCLYNYAVSMCILNNLLCKSDILCKRLRRSIDHNGSKSAVDTGLT